MNQTNNQHFHDLTFDLMDDGTVKLTQTDCGEDYVITVSVRPRPSFQVDAVDSE